MDEYREKFLLAEEQASQLVEHLQKLKDEAVNYNDAKLSLEDTQGKLNDLFESQNKIAIELNSLLDTLSNLDTLKILEALSVHKQQSEDSFHKLEETITAELSKLNGDVTNFHLTSKSNNKLLSRIQLITITSVGLVLLFSFLIIIFLLYSIMYR